MRAYTIIAAFCEATAIGGVCFAVPILVFAAADWLGRRHRALYIAKYFGSELTDADCGEFTRIPEGALAVGGTTRARKHSRTEYDIARHNGGVTL